MVTYGIEFAALGCFPHVCYNV